MSDAATETKTDSELVTKIAAVEQEAAKQAQPPKLGAPIDPRLLPPPPWFNSIIAHLFLLYPGSTINEGVVLCWWHHLGGLPPQILTEAFARAPGEVPAQVVPSAELVRRVAMQMMGEQQQQKAVGR